MKIGVMGDQGSFSDEAALLYIRRNKIKKPGIKYLTNAGNVLKNLKNKKIDLGILPIANSSVGIVKEATMALEKYPFKLESSFIMPIRHYLFAKNNKQNIRKIVSHIQALEQCKRYIEKKFLQVRSVKYEDTAKAAKDLSRGKLTRDCAIIAPKNCGKIYHLRQLDSNIQDNKNNKTTFLVIKL